MAEKKDIPEVFWNKWLDLDTEGRIRLLGTTMLAREYTEHLSVKFGKAKLGKRYIKELAARHFNDYLEDLAAVIEAKNQKV